MSTRRRIELVIEPLPASPGVRIDPVETHRYYPLSGLSEAPQAFLLRLQDSAGLIHWEPWGEEGPLVGRAFAAVLARLYDGRCWVINLGMNSAPLGETADECWGEDEYRQHLLGHMSARGLSHAFTALGADPDFPEDQLAMDYWRCPKRSLGMAFADTWSQRSAGYVVPRPERSALQACFGLKDPMLTLECLLTGCRLMFQGRREGEEMAVVSRHLTRHGIEAAVRSPSVERALDALTEVAVFSEPVPRRTQTGGTVHVVTEKPRSSTELTVSDRDPLNPRGSLPSKRQ